MALDRGGLYALVSNNLSSGSKIPASNHRTVENAIIAAMLDSNDIENIIKASGYNTSYFWKDQNAQDETSLLPPSDDERGLRLDTGEVWQWNSGSWLLYGELDNLETTPNVWIKNDFTELVSANQIRLAAMIQNGQSSGVSSAVEITLPANGNYVNILNNTTPIELISITDTVGKSIQGGTYYFLGVTQGQVIKHLASETVTHKSLLLNSGEDWEAPTDSFLIMMFDSELNVWRINTQAASTGGSSNSQGTDLIVSSYLTLQPDDNIYFIDDTGEISGVNKDSFTKGHRITLIPKNGCTLKHFSPGVTNEIPFWFWSKNNVVVSTDYFAIDFELLELSAPIKTALGITQDYIWGAIETGITGETLLKDIFIELGDSLVFTVDSSSYIDGGFTIESNYTYTHEGNAGVNLDSANNRITFTSSGSFCGLKIYNSTGTLMLHFLGTETPRNKITEAPEFSIKKIFDVENKGRYFLFNWSGLERSESCFGNHYNGFQLVELNDIIINVPIANDGTKFLDV